MKILIIVIISIIALAFLYAVVGLILSIRTRLIMKRQRKAFSDALDRLAKELDTCDNNEEGK